MAVFEAYIDDGGVPDKNLLCLASYIAKAERWREFEADWLKLLSDFNVSHIHLKDVLNLRTKLYEHLDSEQRSEMMGRAADAIRTHIDVGFVIAMYEDHYRRITDPEFRSKWGSAFATAASALLNLLVEEVGNLDSNNSEMPHILNLYIEDGHRNTREALVVFQDVKERLNRLYPKLEPPDDTLMIPDPTFVAPSHPVRIGEIGVGSKKGDSARTPLQAADILVYSTVRGVTRGNRDDLAGKTLDRVEEKTTHKCMRLAESEIQFLVDAAREQASLEEKYRRESFELGHVLHKMGLRIENKGDAILIEIPEDWSIPNDIESE